MTAPEEVLDADERTTLEQSLDLQRSAVLAKVEGLTADQLATPHPPTSLTLAGLVYHLALVEESWLEERFLGRPIRPPFDTVDWDADPDWEFHTANGLSPDEVIGRYRLAAERARAVVAATPDLDRLSAGTVRNGRFFTLRWVLIHLIEETARHAGHMDLIREAIDGRTGS